MAKFNPAKHQRNTLSTENDLAPGEWIFRDADAGKINTLANSLHLPKELVVPFLINGISTKEAIALFFNNTLKDCHNPFDLPDMEKGLTVLNQAITNKEKIFIFGDKDVDGICSSAILISYFENQGVSLAFDLPTKQTGYGLTAYSVNTILSSGAKLLITIDCGITNVPEIQTLKANGIDTIVIDHHTPLDTLPKAAAIIDPKLEKSTYPFKDLCATALAFKFCLCHLIDTSSNYAAFPSTPVHQNFINDTLDLVLLGTLADIVPISGENRILVDQGMTIFKKSRRPGLKALINRLNLTTEYFSAEDITFRIVPALNAAGRIDTPIKSLQLLLSKEMSTADHLAETIINFNTIRKKLQNIGASQAEKLVLAEGLHKNKLIIVANEQFDKGIIGIIAARLLERFGLPTIVVSTSSDEFTGSGRCNDNFNLVAFMANFQDLFERFGGHQNAIGFSIRPENYTQLINTAVSRANTVFAEHTFKAERFIDTRFSAEMINLKLIETICRIEPLVQKTKLLCLTEAVTPQQIKVMGKSQNHLKFKCLENQQLDWVLWNFQKEHYKWIQSGKKIDILYQAGVNRWRDRTTPQLEIVDLRPHDNPII